MQIHIILLRSFIVLQSGFAVNIDRSDRIKLFGRSTGGFGFILPFHPPLTRRAERREATEGVPLQLLIILISKLPSHYYRDAGTSAKTGRPNLPPIRLTSP